MFTKSKGKPFLKDSSQMRVLTLAIAVFWGLGGCKAKVHFNPAVSGKKTQTEDATKPGPMSASNPPVAADQDEPMSYPLLTFKGKGQMSYSGDNHDIKQRISAKMDKSTLSLNIESFSSSTDQVDSEVKRKVGVDTFIRVAKEKLDEISSKDKSFVNETFIVFSMEVRKKNQKVVTFSSPVPAFIIPAPKTRYETLETGSLSYSSTANIDGVSVPLTFSIQKGTSSAASGDLYEVEVNMEIPSDNDGHIYEQIPIPRRAVYIVDTAQKIVSSLKTVSPFRNDKKNKLENMNLSFGLCSSETNGQTQSFPCQ